MLDGVTVVCRRWGAKWLNSETSSGCVGVTFWVVYASCLSFLSCVPFCPCISLCAICVSVRIVVFMRFVFMGFMGFGSVFHGFYACGVHGFDVCMGFRGFGCMNCVWLWALWGFDAWIWCFYGFWMHGFSVFMGFGCMHLVVLWVLDA